MEQLGNLLFFASNSKWKSQKQVNILLMIHRVNQRQKPQKISQIRVSFSRDSQLLFSIQILHELNQWKFYNIWPHLVEVKQSAFVDHYDHEFSCNCDLQVYDEVMKCIKIEYTTIYSGIYDNGVIRYIKENMMNGIISNFHLTLMIYQYIQKVITYNQCFLYNKSILNPRCNSINYLNFIRILYIQDDFYNTGYIFLWDLQKTKLLYLKKIILMNLDNHILLLIRFLQQCLFYERMSMNYQY
ncbi:unnamed protein product [Paramecium pentaurelia]|uniref:Uncharacterized protein n=1 Tax=Paramecium pentaurelia TaxID=43138 RepID=A0A8S1XZJ8_9CILI|nr:unnamed protein product [Paramecium pentaurelia]